MVFDIILYIRFGSSFYILVDIMANTILIISSFNLEYPGDYGKVSEISKDELKPVYEKLYEELSHEIDEETLALRKFMKYFPI